MDAVVRVSVLVRLDKDAETFQEDIQEVLAEVEHGLQSAQVTYAHLAAQVLSEDQLYA